MTADIKTMIFTIGGGAAGWQTKAAGVLGLSRSTVLTALAGDASDKTLRKIRATYAALARHVVPQDADKTAGHWVIGMPLKKTTDKSILEECVVTHLPEPTFSAHIILRAGKTAPGPKGERAVEVRMTTVLGDKAGVGSLLEKAREIGLDYLKKSQFDRLEMMYRDDVEARAVAAKWGSAKEARGARIAELVDAFDVLTDDDVQAAHDMIRTMQSEAMEPKREMGTLSAREAEVFDAGRQTGQIEARAMLLSELLSEIVSRRDRGETIPGARVVRRAVADMTPVQHVYRGAEAAAEKAEKARVASVQERHDEARHRVAEIREHAHGLLREAGIEVSDDFIPADMSWIDATHTDDIAKIEAEVLAARKWTETDTRKKGKEIADIVAKATQAN